jgi:inner membrane protein
MALGAAVGNMVMDDKAGKKGLLWGALAGAVPDLDLIPPMFLDTLSKLTIHRGLTHSLFFIFLFSPLFGYLLYRYYKNGTGVLLWRWIWLIFLVLLSHMALDCFTSYGTMIFYPFSKYRIAICSISVLDPLYSIPLIISVTALLFISVNRRRVVNFGILIFSIIYLSVTLVNKAHVASRFGKSLASQGVTSTRIFTNPTLFNNLLWFGAGETDQYYYTGYYSLADGSKPIRFYRIAKNHHLISDLADNESIRTLTWFAKGFYYVEHEREKIKLNDLRYGFWVQQETSPVPVMSFIITEENDGITVRRKFFRVPPQKLFRKIFNRIAGGG